MKLIINNIAESIDKETLTISELLQYKHYTFKMIVVRVNGKPIKKDDYDKTYLNDGDNIQVIHLISGG